MTTPGGTRVVLIAAVARNGVIGAGGAIPWHLPEDFAHFKRTTLGLTLLMGRATYDSIGRALPGRTTIVLTRAADWRADGVLTAASLDAAFTLADQQGTTLYVAGGAAVYAATMPYADEQLLSEIDLEPEGDTLYPPFDSQEWVETSREPCAGFELVRLSRR